MLKIISSFLETECWAIHEIVMMEEDDLSSSLKVMIESGKKNPGTILSLFNYLRSIIDDSSIEVKRIYLSGRDNNGTLRKVLFRSMELWCLQICG